MAENALYSILIVDDNPNNLFTLRALLEDALDANVIEADSGMVALQQILSHDKIDLILLDIQMPEMDGFEVARLIRSRKRSRDIPIIFLTAVYKSEEFKEKGLKGGAIDYLTKPIDDDILLNRVSAYLRLIEGERVFNRQLEQANQQLQAEIEERKRAEQALQEQSQFLQNLIDNIPNPVFYKDVEGVYTGCNRAFETYLGVSREHIIGKTMYELVSPEQAQEYYEKDQALFQNPGVQTYESQITRADGQQRDVIFNKATYSDLDGNLNGLIGVIVDITERKQAEQALHALNQQLEDASRHKSDFLSSMSHELRTPLNAMIGYTSLTLNAVQDILPPEHLRNLTKAEQSARTLLQLINDVLDFSKIESGQMDILLEDVELDDVIDEVLITAEGVLLDRPVELKSEIADDLPVIETDYTKIKQMLNNLVGNAIKFTESGYIAVRAQPIDDGQAVQLDVEDTGTGIHQENLKTIFESFKQADGSIKRKFGGTGLGLAITKNFADMLGIELSVESQVGQGTRFWMRIPVQSPVEQPKVAGTTVPVDAATSEHADDTAAQGETAAADQTYSVLVVDDDELNLQVVENTFKSVGYTLYIAESGEKALQMAKTVRPDVILMDLAMPDMDGLEATTLLKQDPATADITVIACSALATEDTKAKAFEVGCEGFASRPIEPQNLITLVTNILKRSQNKQPAVQATS
jgi:PAS domain S-box-containing protein